jgi:prophage antirepressor
MEQIIKIFENEEFGKIRTVVKDGEPWFVGKDAAKILGYAKPRNAIAAHVDNEDKKDALIQGDLGGTQKMTVINESGIYSLIMSSKLPKAKEFKRWVTAEILPTIRKTGGYVANEDMFIENYLPFLDEPYRNLFRLQMVFIDKLNERIRHDQPLVEFANQVAGTENLIDMNAMAKLAVEKNIQIGRNRLFSWLRKNGILMSDNLPYQKFIDRGYFAVKETVFETSSMMKTHQQTLVTGKGQRFIIGRLKKEFGEVE